MADAPTFSQMPYERPDLAAACAQVDELSRRMASAATLEEADAAFLEKDQLDRHVMTLETIAHIRHVVDTRDEFYDA